MTLTVLKFLGFFKKNKTTKKSLPIAPPSSPLTIGHYTWSTENIKDETGQHEGQDRPIVTQGALPKLFCPAPDGAHFTGAPRDLLEQSSDLRLLICQLYLRVQEGTQPSLPEWRARCETLQRLRVRQRALTSKALVEAGGRCSSKANMPTRKARL